MERPSARDAGARRAGDIAAGIVPNWLWFWLFLYLLALPGQMRNVWLALGSELFSSVPLPGESQIPLTFFLRMAHVAELMPLVLVAMGVATLAAPGRWARRLEKVYRLTLPPELPPIVEIRQFLDRYVPGVVLRANLLRGDELAMAYPLGWRRPAIAIFGPFVKLWSRDREAAEAVLLHEAGHCCSGDTGVIGAGSPLRLLLDRWPALLLVTVVLPMCCVWSVEVLRFLVMPSTLSTELRVVQKLTQTVTLAFPMLVRTCLGLAFWSAGAVVLPLAAIWAAEFAADATAIETAGTAAPLLRVLARTAVSPSWRSRLAVGMSHPPAALRRRVARMRAAGHAATHPAGARAVTGAVSLLFPAATLVRLLLLLARATLAYLAYQPVAAVLPALAGHMRTYVASMVPVWIGMVGLLLVWMWVRPVWLRLWASCAAGTLRFRGRGLWLEALVLLLVGMLLVWTLGGSIY